MTRRVIDLNDDAILQQTARALWEHDQKSFPSQAQADWERIDPMERCDYRDAASAILAVLAEVGVPAHVGWGVRTPDGREIPFITEAGANGAAVIGDQPRTVLRRFTTDWEAVP